MSTEISAAIRTCTDDCPRTVKKLWLGVEKSALSQLRNAFPIVLSFRPTPCTTRNRNSLATFLATPTCTCAHDLTPANFNPDVQSAHVQQRTWASQTGPSWHASLTNTSRQLGAGFSVNVLGTVVNAHLTGDLTLRMKALDTPSKLTSINISAVATGIVLSSVKGGGSIKDHVIQSEWVLFHSGLERLVENASIAMPIAAIAAQTLDARARIKFNPSSSDSRASRMLVSCDE
jgi:hypothetical protein